MCEIRDVSESKRFIKSHIDMPNTQG
jgi:hypothetical protein